MALTKKPAGKTTNVIVDFPPAPPLFTREPDRQKLFEDWYDSHNRAVLLKLQSLASSLDSKADKV